MTHEDDIARLTSIVVRQHQGGLSAGMRFRSDMTEGGIGKACGVTPEQVTSWERGESQPTTQQALAWLTYLYDHDRGYGRDPDPLVNGQREWYGRQPEKPADIREVVLKAGGRHRVFAPDMNGKPKGDLEELLADLAKRQFPGSSVSKYRLFYPPNAFFACLAEAAGSGAIKVEHALSKEHAEAVHYVLWAAVERLPEGDRDMSAAVWLAEQWDLHLKWKGPIQRGDVRFHPRGGPDPEVFRVTGPAVMVR